MGKILDALLCRSSKASKFNTLVNFAVARLVILKSQKQARCSVAHSDVVQLLQLSQQDRALIRVEQVIKEQNMLDVLVMIEGYCILLSERFKLIEQHKECPDELKEAIASLIFAASRCGEFPELQRMRSVFESRYGKEFILRAIQLRNNCGVSPKIIQKLSTRQPSLEDRTKVLKEVADANGISLQLEETSSVVAEEKLDKEENNRLAKNQSAGSGAHFADPLKDLQEQTERVGSLSLSMDSKKQYKDVAEASQDAFLAAAYAAAAARAAIELSRSGPSSSSSRSADDLNTSNYVQRNQVLNSNNKGKIKGGVEDRIFSWEIEESSRATMEQSRSSSSSSCTIKPPDDQNTSNYDQRKQVSSSNNEGKTKGTAEDRIFSWEKEDSVFYHLNNYSLDSDDDDDEVTYQSYMMMHSEKVNPKGKSLSTASRVYGKIKQNLIFYENDGEGKSDKINANGDKDECRDKGTRLIKCSHNQIAKNANSREDNEKQVCLRDH